MLAVAALALLPAGALAEELPSEFSGRAILDHAAGKAVVAASRLLKAGKLAQVKQASTREVRGEWLALAAAEREADAATARERAPEPDRLAADIARGGVLTIYGDSAKLHVASADGSADVLAFVSLEDGQWRVTAGPMTVDTRPVVETAPALRGAEILEHEIGKLVLAYARSVEAGQVEEAMALATDAARRKRLAASAQERQESDRFRQSVLPGAAVLAEQIRAGGKVTFEGERAYLDLASSTRTQNADGSVSYSSTSVGLPLALENGHWRIAD